MSVPVLIILVCVPVALCANVYTIVMTLKAQRLNRNAHRNIAEAIQSVNQANQIISETWGSPHATDGVPSRPDEAR